VERIKSNVMWKQPELGVSVVIISIVLLLLLGTTITNADSLSEDISTATREELDGIQIELNSSKIVNDLVIDDICSGDDDGVISQEDEELMIRTLFDWCVQDKICSSLYYQRNKPNMAIFSYFVRDLIHEKTLFYPAKNILCSERMKADQITSLLYSKSDRNNKQKISSSAIQSKRSFSASSYSDANKNLWLLMMTAHKKLETEYVACGTNERLSVSDDGMTINCACSEDEDCNVETRQVSNFLYTATGLLIFLFALVFAGIVYSIHQHIETYKSRKRTNDATPLVKGMVM
jgi:hypothetical protein